MNPFEQPLIRVQGLGKVFSTEEVDTHALSDISLEIRAGEYVSISGPSGCGKSTLLSILGLLEAPSTGEYLFGGRSTSELSEKQRAEIRCREVGFLFQAFHLVSHLTVAENVELPLLYQNRSAAECRRRVGEVLERVRMDHRAGHYPHQLSGGQQQRVAVARSAVAGPRVLLADEPTGNLDSTNGQAVMELLDELHQDGTTICMVTHDTRYMARSERSLELFDGRIRSAAEKESWIPEELGVAV